MIPVAPIHQNTRRAITPLVADVLFSQSVDCSRRDIPEYGTPHPDSVRWPHHKFVYFSPLDGAAANGRDEMYEFFYAADRENQDLYNFEHSQADIGSTKFDTINRSYVFLRSEYDEDVPAQGSTGPDANHVLAVRKQTRIDMRELDSLYIAEVRTYVQKVTLTNIAHNRDSGTVLYEKTTLYYRGEVVSGSAIESLFANTGSNFWKVQSSGYANKGEQISDNWFAVTEYEVVDISSGYEYEWSKLYPPKFYCPQLTTTTVTTAVVGTAGYSPTPAGTDGQQIAVVRRGNVLITKTTTQGGTKTVVKSTTIEDRTGDIYLVTQEIVPASEVVDTGSVDEDGEVVLYSEYSACYAIKTTQTIASTAVREWVDIQTYEWPAVLESITFKAWPRRDGKADEIHADVRFKEGYNGPQKVDVRQWWQKEAYEVIPPTPMLAKGFSYTCPIFRISVPPCLHDVVTFSPVTTGTTDPDYEFTTDSWSVQATNLKDWPEEIVWSEAKPHRGGYIVTEYTIAAPTVTIITA